MTLTRAWVEASIRAHGDRHVCYVALKGSRLFGIAEEDADVDLRGFWLARTPHMLRLRKPSHTLERTFDHEGMKMDFVSYEAERYMHHLLGHNGNFVEALLVPDGYYWADHHGEELRAIAPKFLTKRLKKFYSGFAHNQFKKAGKQVKTGKHLAYTYRELYAGIHLLRTGSLEFDWPTLRKVTEQDILDWESAVLQRIDMDREAVGDETLRIMQKEFLYLDDKLNQAGGESPLPEDYDALEQLDAILYAWRIEGLR